MTRWNLNRSCFSRLCMMALTLMMMLAVSLSMTTARPQEPSSKEPKQRERIVNTRRVFVRSTSLLVRAAVVEDKLLRNSQFKQMGFVLTRDPRDADFVLELRHDLLTKYVFTVVDTKTMTVVAGAKLSSLGGTVGGKVAKRFVKEMSGIG